MTIPKALPERVTSCSHRQTNCQAFRNVLDSHTECKIPRSQEGTSSSTTVSSAEGDANS
ncbi:unnamed protein product [Taenia asiatica]|uniref:Uncharacterized protein n=1 Tax=Taenia asiatica TaxID=60517 RepID=A0A3P6QLS1_TAEAS|nr:unnamed protein product [Taenia asiatica]